MNLNTIASIVVIFLAILVAWKFVFFALKWVIIGGVLYLGYRLFLSKDRRIRR